MCPIAAAVWFVLMTITMQKPLDLPQIGIEFIVADTLLRDLHVNGELRSGDASWWAVSRILIPLSTRFLHELPCHIYWTPTVCSVPRCCLLCESCPVECFVPCAHSYISSRDVKRKTGQSIGNSAEDFLVGGAGPFRWPLPLLMLEISTALSWHPLAGSVHGLSRMVYETL